MPYIYLGTSAPSDLVPRCPLVPMRVGTSERLGTRLPLIDFKDWRQAATPLIPYMPQWRLGGRLCETTLSYSDTSFSNVKRTGRQLGVGSYGIVEELEINSLICAGKRIHEALIAAGNAGVQRIAQEIRTGMSADVGYEASRTSCSS